MVADDADESNILLQQLEWLALRHSPLYDYTMRMNDASHCRLHYLCLTEAVSGSAARHGGWSAQDFMMKRGLGPILWDCDDAAEM